MDGWMFFEFLFVSFFSFSFLSSVFFFVSDVFDSSEKKHPTRKKKPNATFRQRERENRER